MLLISCFAIPVLDLIKFSGGDRSMTLSGTRSTRAMDWHGVNICWFDVVGAISKSDYKL